MQDAELPWEVVLGAALVAVEREGDDVLLGRVVVVCGVVSRDGREALFALVYLGRSDVAPRGRFTLAGLDADRRYSMEAVAPGDRPHGLVAPAWLEAGRGDRPPLYSGRGLQSVGLQTPEADPEQVLILRPTS